MPRSPHYQTRRSPLATRWDAPLVVRRGVHADAAEPHQRLRPGQNPKLSNKRLATRPNPLALRRRLPLQASIARAHARSSTHWPSPLKNEVVLQPPSTRATLEASSPMGHARCRRASRAQASAQWSGCQSTPSRTRFAAPSSKALCDLSNSSRAAAEIWGFGKGMRPPTAGAV